MTTKEKARALAKARTKSKRKQEKKASKQLEIAKESEEMERKIEEKGVQGRHGLLVFDHLLNNDEHILAQAGALGLYREHLKHTLSKMRLSLQPYDKKRVAISGVITEAKFNENGIMTAIMLANPEVTSDMKTSTFFDSHIWLHFNELMPTLNDTFHLGLGCMLKIEATITSYKSHGKFKYGIKEWIITNCGISYFVPPQTRGFKPPLIDLEHANSDITAPIAKVSNIFEAVWFQSCTREEYSESLDYLAREYSNMGSHISIAGRKGVDALSEKVGTF